MTVPPEAVELLTSEPLMAHLATSVDDRPHVAPVWYAYHDGVIEILTSGRKLANLRENPKVAVSIQKDEGGRAQWMVTLQGRATVIEDEEATMDAVRRINPKYGGDEESFPENTLVRIEIGNVAYRKYDVA